MTRSLQLLAPAEHNRASPAQPAAHRGRFAPSPTGPLHFGSLLAAVASYAQAKSNQAEWLVRIEDIDPPREQPGSDQLILRALEAYGFEWDGPVTYQSTLTERHESAVAELLEAGFAYPCGCSRRDLVDVPRGPLGAIYPGTCRMGCSAPETAIRLRTNDAPITFTDALQGAQTQHLESESGDFIIKRRDGLIAYHLAAVVDDHDQGIGEIVRGIDLIDSTPRHVWVQRALNMPIPAYMHIPVAVNEYGQKLSKLTGAAPISEANTGATLYRALSALRQAPPASLDGADPADIWHWVLPNWRPDVLQGLQDIPPCHYDFG